MSDNQNVVVDNGSGVLKAGMSGADKPNVKFPAIVGRPRGGGVIGGQAPKDFYIGEEAAKLKGVLNLAHPIANGIVKDWDNMNRVWEYAFANELRVDPTEIGVMLTEAPNNPKENREKMVELMFENHQVLRCYVAIQAVLSLYSNGRVTGAVCDSGDGVSHTVPVFEGFQIPHAVMANHIAGRAITDHMVTLLNKDGISAGAGSNPASW